MAKASEAPGGASDETTPAPTGAPIGASTPNVRGSGKAEAKAARSSARAEAKAAKASAKAEARARRAQKVGKRKDKPAKKPRQKGDLGRQLRALLTRSIHPRIAIAAMIVGILGGLLTHRGLGAALMAGLALLVTQAVNGIGNDVSDRDSDAKAKRPGKPIAEGIVPAGNASFVALCLAIVAIPLSLTHGTVAGLCLLATLVVGWLYNTRLHATVLSWLPWALTFALVVFFFAYGGPGLGVHGSAPGWLPVLTAAILGVGVHILTSAPGLVADNAGGTRHLPLRLGLKLGASKVLLLGIVLTAIGLIGLIVALSTSGLHG